MRTAFKNIFWRKGQPTVIFTALSSILMLIIGAILNSSLASKNDLISQQRAAVLESMVGDIEKFKDLSSELEKLTADSRYSLMVI